jgi:hypothetical protein
MLVERGSTKMLNIRRLIALGVLFVTGMAGAVSFGRNQAHKDDYVYDQLVTIKGKVQILNHPELGMTEGSHMSLVFQRAGCRKCLVVARTDADGKYEIGLSRGRYKLILRESRGGGAPSYDLLAPDQPRYINATSVLQPNVFDVRVVLPPK